MIRRGADKRQPGGDIHPIIESQQLQRDVPLVVIHRHHHVVHPLMTLHKHRIRRTGAGHLHALRPHGGHRGGDDADLFIAKQAVLPGVRVDAGDRNTRTRIADAAQKPIRHANHRLNPRLIEGIEELAQGNMGRDMDNFKFLGIQHHGVICSLRQVGQQFGMAGISVPGEMQRLFIQRCGSDGRDRALQCEGGRPSDATKCQIARLSLDFARTQPLRIAERFIDNVNRRRGKYCFGGMVDDAQLHPRRDIQRQDPPQRLRAAYHHHRRAAQRPLGEGFNNNLRTNTCRVAHCDCNHFRHSVSPQ